MKPTAQDLLDALFYLSSGTVMAWGCFDAGLRIVGWLFTLATLAMAVLYLLYFIRGIRL